MGSLAEERGNPKSIHRCMCQRRGCGFCERQTQVMVEQEIVSCLLTYAIINGGVFWPVTAVGVA